MREPERAVLHVLPHPGGGGETYVDVLGAMQGYRFTRAYLAPRRKPSPVEIVRGLVPAASLVRRHDLLHVHGEGAGGLFLPLLARRPSVVTLHGLHLLRRVDGALRRAAALNLKAIVVAADGTICVSETEYDELVAAVGRVAVGRAVVIRNGARRVAPASEGERSLVRRELGLEPSEPVAIWLGALDERRDPLTVVRAAERAHVALLVVGDGALRADVERAAGTSTRVLGQRRDVSRLLGAADFFVLASWREGLSFALVEAMAHGLPAVVSDVPENVEAVDGTGIFVAGDDEDAYAAALRRLADDPAERAALGEQARVRAADLFDVDEMIRRTRAVYDDVLARQER